MITVMDIYRYLDDIAPFDTALSYDNCGILVGSPDAEVKKCLVCLDVTKQVAHEACENDCTLILSHHPVIFHGVKQISTGSLLDILMKSNLTILSAHTNLDMAEKGVNYQLARACGLTDFTPLPAEAEQQTDGFGLIGRIAEPLLPKEFVRTVKQALNAPCIKYTDGARPIQTVAVSCGSGAFLLDEAIMAGADALVTAEVKHHELLLAKEAGLTLLDAGHYETEQLIVKPLCRMLSDHFGEVSFQPAKSGVNPAAYL